MRKIKKAVLDTLFPISCLGCQKNDFWLCEKCFEKITFQKSQRCPSCEKTETPYGNLCRPCRAGISSHLDALISAADYEDPVIKKLVYNFKYRFARDLSATLSRIILKSLSGSELPLPAAIVPVPLHPRRLRWRGFNQSELLAKKISFRLSSPLSIPVLDILVRKKYNKPQMEIKSYGRRLKNVEGIFLAKPGPDLEKIKGKKVLLVDDIATTGATLEECAKALKNAGAKKVFAAVIARQAAKK